MLIQWYALTIGSLSVTIMEKLSFFTFTRSFWARFVRSFLKDWLKAIGFPRQGMFESVSIASLLCIGCMCVRLPCRLPAKIGKQVFRWFLCFHKSIKQVLSSTTLFNIDNKIFLSNKSAIKRISKGSYMTEDVQCDIIIYSLTNQILFCLFQLDSWGTHGLSPALWTRRMQVAWLRSAVRGHGPVHQVSDSCPSNSTSRACNVLHSCQTS